MASSGSVDYTWSAQDIIEGAYNNIGMLGEGRTLSAYRAQIGLKKLNGLVKQISGQSDFSAGLKMWSRKRGYLFLQQSQNTYQIGPSGDKCASSYTRTTLSANAAQGASTITVSATTGFASTYNIGIVLDSGAIFWTTETGSPSGSVITLASVTTGAASSGNTVFVYQSAMRRPLSILTANRRDISSQDTAMYPMSLYDYEAIGDKTAETSPLRYYYEQQLTNGVIYIDGYPVDVNDVISFVYLSPIEDLDALSDSIDYAQPWGRYLQLQLGADLGLVYQRPMSQEYKMMLEEAKAIAKNDVAETTDIYFQPNED